MGDAPRTWAALACDAARGGPRIRALPARSRSASRGARGGPAARQVRPCGPLPLHRCADPGADRGGEHAAHRRTRPRRFRRCSACWSPRGCGSGKRSRWTASDFDADTGTLTVRNAKFGKSRELPLHPTTTSALTRYLRRRDRPRPVGPTEALLLSSVGHQAVDQQRADLLPGVARPRGDPAALGCVPAQASRHAPQLRCEHTA